MKTNKTLFYAYPQTYAQPFFENYIEDNINEEDIICYTKRVDSYEVLLKDGTLYKTVSASDSSRGYKCDKAYVASNVNKEIIDNVIRPTLAFSPLPEEEQITYF